MQGLLARHNQLSVSETQNTTKEARKDAATKLMETATNMMKSGVTPDVVTFIETTITEVNANVLGAIVEEHHRDQTLINNLLAQFDDAIAIMEACAASVNQEHTDRTAASLAHRTCRSGEALDCARSRKCEEELEQLWSIVKVEEEEMRRLHLAIHGEWCIGPSPPHPGLGDPFNWVPGAYHEGPETSQSIHDYPAVDLTTDVIQFRSFSVDFFGQYMIQKPKVETAWYNYNTKLLECAEKEETLETKVEQCDTLQVTVHDQACAHASTSRACASQFGRQYHMTLVSYNQAVATITQLEYDRKREWETLHIVTCLLETVYTRVIHSIDSGEPCPTEESHPDQTTSEINECHIISESMTANLTIDYGNPPEPPDLPTIVAPPCTAQYLWDEHGEFPSGVQTSHTQAIEDEGLGSYFATLSVKGWAGCAAPRACITCGDPEVPTDDSYVDNSVCKEHQQHLHPGQLDWDSFKCLSGDECIRSSGRCNGVDNCADGSDESNCETSWGLAAVLNREECQDPLVSDVQFRCLDNACIPIEGKCNGVNNCADGSDESGCVAGTTGVTLEPTTGRTATIETPALQSTVFSDRQYTFDSLGSFTGYSYVKMWNDDKHIRHSHVQMKLRLPQPTVVYVVKLDDYELPWLEADGWAISSVEGVSYHGIRQTRHTDWSGVLEEDHYGPGLVWQKTFTAGTVEMRGNNGGDGSYLIFVANPANPPSASTDLWQRHLPDAGNVKCNLNVDLHYVADQAACQQLAVTSGHPFYSFRHNGESHGHKCFSSATCDSPLTERSNQWAVYQSAAEIFDSRLTAYWESGSCGPHGNDWNWGWCGNQNGECPAEHASDICPSGLAELAAFYGTRAANSYQLGGCNYFWFAQYRCKVQEAAQCIGTYEAEEAALSGAIVHANTNSANHQGFTGSSFVDYLNPNTDFIEWSLPSCRAGTATLSFRYSLAGGNRPLQVLVNGAEATDALSFPATGAWNQWGEASLTVSLSSGSNTVRLVAAGSSGANMDSLTVSQTNSAATWELIAHQSVGHWFPASARVPSDPSFAKVNEADSSASAFMNVGTLVPGAYSIDGKYHLRLVYDGVTEQHAAGNDGSPLNGGIQEFEWTQTSWITANAVTGYTPITDAFLAGSPTAGCVFHGLARSSTSATVFDGSPDHGNWFHSVGSTQQWGAGIPAFKGGAAQSMSLYIIRE